MRRLELIFDLGVSKASSCCLDITIIDFSTKVFEMYAIELAIPKSPSYVDVPHSFFFG